jgi:AcrR family transcriptional regulator
MDENLIQPDDNRPSRADAVKNRQLLLEISQQLFDEQGVEAVTMSAIAKSAGVGKGTLYRHFRDKAEICHALLDQEMRDLQEHTFRRLRAGDDPLTQLQWFMEQALRFVDRNSTILCEASHHTTVSLLQHPAHLWWRQTIIGLLGRMNVSGDVDYIADILYVMLDVQTIRFQRNILNYEISRIIDGMKSALHLLAQTS